MYIHDTPQIRGHKQRKQFIQWLLQIKSLLTLLQVTISCFTNLLRKAYSHLYLNNLVSNKIFIERYTRIYSITHINIASKKYQQKHMVWVQGKFSSSSVIKSYACILEGNTSHVPIQLTTKKLRLVVYNKRLQLDSTCYSCHKYAYIKHSKEEKQLLLYHM